MKNSGLKVEYLPPSPPLAECVSHYWIIRGRLDGERRAQTIYPRPTCSLTVQLTAPATVRGANGAPTPRPRSFVKGHFAAPFTLEYPGEFASAGVVFRPGRAHRLLHTSEEECLNTFIGLADFSPAGARLEERVIDAGGAEEIARAFDEFLLARLRAERTVDRTLSDSLLAVELAGHALTVEALARRLGLSRRTLHRLFVGRLGLGPKYFLRLWRFYLLLRSLRARGGRSLTELAYEFGYFDQAHMINSFSAFTGQAPGDYLKGQSAVNDISIRAAAATV
ncbi:MAG TPA: helix-turn-helix domain-containing protein [candidate division Zixibacteria bacterium]|nr:helix-turn-helix domain-containing protein [candidate division Zixibacteria bacterium]